VGPATGQVALEVMTRRYYRIRRPEGFEASLVDGRPVVRATYVDAEDQRIHVLTMACAYRELVDELARVPDLVAGVPPSEMAVVDLYTWADDGTVEDARAAAEVASLLDGVEMPATVQRIVVAVGRPDLDERTSAVGHVTFRRSPSGFVEDGFLRGLHPLMAARLELSRLRNFDLYRLPSLEDSYLFRAVARENPKDERLFAIAEVRDLTPVVDEAGVVVALPQLERHFQDALSSIRQFQAPRPPDERLQWNRVVLHVWPPLHLSIDEIAGITRRLAPATEGLGLEGIIVRCRRPRGSRGRSPAGGP